MSFLHRRQRIPAPVPLTARFLCLLVILLPVLLVAFLGGNALIARLNAILEHAAPLASAEASRTLRREVRIGRLSPNLTVGSIWDMATNRHSLGTLPIVAEDVAVANDGAIAASGLLASARRVSLSLSVPTLLSGDMMGAVTRIVAESPQVLLVRNAEGRFNVQDLVPKKPPGQPEKPPFRTIVEINDGIVRFRDHAAKLSPASLPALNTLSQVEAIIDLTGARAIQFELSAQGQPGTVTKRRLGGELFARGSAARGTPGRRPDSPLPDAPMILTYIRARDADAAYWIDYFLDVPDVRITEGRADIDLTLVGQQPKIEGAKPPEPSLSGLARISGVRVVGDKLPVPIEGVAGTVRFDEASVVYDISAGLFGERLFSAGTVWNLPQPGTPKGVPAAIPEVAVTLRAPRLPIQRALAAFMDPGQKLPDDLSLGGVASLDASINGSIRDPVVSAQAFVPRVGYRGAPDIANVRASLTYAAGVLGVTDVKANIAGGGSISGKLALRIGQVGPDGTLNVFQPDRQNAAFAFDVANVDLGTLEALRAVQTNKRLRLRGRGDVQIVGSRAGTSLTAAANVTTRGLRVGNIPFSTAQARVLVQNNRVFVPAATIVSSVGRVGISGDVTDQGGLALRFAAAGVDLSRIGEALDLPGLEGVVNISGSVGGTVKDPRINVRELLGLNLRFKTFEADVLRGSLTATRSRIVLGNNVSIRRFPAEVTIAGQVTGLERLGQKNAAPTLNLTVNATNIDYAEIDRQIRQVTASASKVAGPPPPPPVVGVLREAKLRVTGTTLKPNIVGSASVERILLGEYPVEGGTLEFAYRDGRAQIRNAVLTASIGEITATADVSPKGDVSGSFQARNLDLERLSFLTQRYASLGGTVSLEGTFSGTQVRPILTARIIPSNISVAGLQINDLAAEGIRAVLNTKENAGRVEIPSISFRQSGSRFAITNTFFDLKSRRVATTLAVETGDIGVLLDSVRNSRLSDTDVGARLVGSLNRLPDPVGGQFAIERLTVRGRVTDEGFKDSVINASLSARDVRVGQFTADTFAAAGSFASDVVTLENFRVVSRRTTITAGGTVDLNGNMDVVVDSNEADFDLVRAFLPSFPLRGTVDLSIAAQGPTRRPTVAASLFGRDILVVTPGNPGKPVAAEPSAVAVTPAAAGEAAAAAAETAKAEKGLVLGLVRAEARIQAGKTAEDPARIVVSEILVRRGESEVRAGGFLPFSYDTYSIPSDRALEVRAEIPRRELSLIASLLAAANPSLAIPEVEKNIKGTLEANVLVAGTLRQPQLSGALVIADGQFTLPGERINAIRDFDATLRFAGARVNVEKFTVALGGPKKPGDDYGSLDMTGSITLDDLQAFLESRDRARTASERAASGTIAGRIDLTAKLNDLRVEEKNLINLGEEARARINGTFFVRGPLDRPRISTNAGAPIVLSSTFLQMPTKSIPSGAAPRELLIDPAFDVRLAIDKRATVANQSAFRFEANGDAYIGGTLKAPDINANLVALGGFYQYAVARFSVVKGGQIAMRVRNVPVRDLQGRTTSETQLGITLTDLTARTTVYAPTGVSLTPSYRASQGGGGIFASTAPPVGGSSNRYRITISINGPLQMGDAINAESARLSFTSDPPLETSQIIALIGTQQQIEMAARGKVEDAAKLAFEQAVNSAIVPQLLAPLQTTLATTLGLEEFSLDYSPNAPLTLRFLKRLPDPLDRFLLSYTRQLQARNQPGAQQPFEISAYYELYELRISKNIQPRLQIGVSTNEQRDQGLFLRGTVAY